MVFYLPHGPDFYGEAFVGFSPDEQAVAGHTISRDGRHIGVTPRALTLEAFHPKNFIELSKRLRIDGLCLIDRVKSVAPVIQITDHRNLTGENALAGRTPIGDRPRFPDVSKIYSKKELGLPQRMVSMVGRERFSEAQGEDISEVAAHVGLCAAYAGMTVVGIGWNDGLDVGGPRLNKVLFAGTAL